MIVNRSLGLQANEILIFAAEVNNYTAALCGN